MNNKTNSSIDFDMSHLAQISSPEEDEDEFLDQIPDPDFQVHESFLIDDENLNEEIEEKLDLMANDPPLTKLSEDLLNATAFAARKEAEELRDAIRRAFFDNTGIGVPKNDPICDYPTWAYLTYKVLSIHVDSQIEEIIARQVGTFNNLIEAEIKRLQSVGEALETKRLDIEKNEKESLARIEARDAQSKKNTVALVAVMAEKAAMFTAAIDKNTQITIDHFEAEIKRRVEKVSIETRKSHESFISSNEVSANNTNESLLTTISSFLIGKRNGK